MNPYRVLAFETLGSTNDEAMARLKGGDPGGLFIVAEAQSGGRGRQGRSWVSPPGNLYASLALLGPSPIAVAPQLGFVSGVALAKVLKRRLGLDARLQIKWPNDVVFAGAKLAGILLESATLPDGRLACVIGFGVNCLSHPEGLAYRATDLREAGDASPDAREVLAALADEMRLQATIWREGAGFAEIRSAWLDLAAGLGERITVATPRERLVGTFAGLDPTGRLLIDQGPGSVTVEAGDVFLPGFGSGAKDP